MTPAHRTWQERVKDAAFAVSCVVFTIIAVAMLLFPRHAHDRVMGAYAVVFFGFGGLLYAAVRRSGRDDGSATRATMPAPEITPHRLALPASRRGFGITAGSLLLAAAASSFCFTELPGVTGAALGTLTSAVAALGAVLLVASLASGPPIVFETDSLHYRWLGRHERRVPYAALAHGSVLALGGEWCVLDLADPEAFLATQPARVRREVAWNQRLYGMAIVLPNRVAPSAEQVLELVGRYASWPAPLLERWPEMPEEDPQR